MSTHSDPLDFEFDDDLDFDFDDSDTDALSLDDIDLQAGTAMSTDLATPRVIAGATESDELEEIPFDDFIEVHNAFANLDPVDRDRVAEAIHTLNHLARRSGLELAAEVHRYVLDTFFGGDYRLFADPSRIKPVAFRALCANERLDFNPTTLQTLVRVGEQMTALPSEVARALSVRHHRLLLSVPESDQREALAEQAAAEGWSTRVLEAEIAAQRAPSRAGRKPLPPVVKSARAIGRSVAALELPTPWQAKALGKAERAELAELVREVEARMKALRAALRGR